MNEDTPSGKNILLTKSFLFAVQIVNTYKCLGNEKEYVLSKQLLRSGTAVGALAREAQNAESKLDFIIKWELLRKNAMNLFIGLNC